MNNIGRNKSLVKNTALFAIGSFGSRILSFLLVPLYTNYLSTAEYGTADLITTTYTVCTFIFSLSIFDAILPFVVKDVGLKDQILGLAEKIILVGGVVYAVLIAVGHARFNISGVYCIYLFCGYMVNAVSRMLSNYLQSTERVKHVVWSGLIQTVTMLVCNIVMITVFEMGIHGYIISLLAGCCLSCIYQYAVVIKNDGIRYEAIDKDLRNSIILYSIPLILNNVFWWVNSSIDRYFVSAMCGTDQNGIYSVASKVPSVLTMCVSFFLQAWGLSAIKEFDPEDKDGFFSNVYSTFNAFITMVCSIVILLIIPIARIMFANDFFVAWKYASILLISMLFSSLSSFVGAIFSAVKESKLFAVSTVFAAITNIVLNWILIPQYGVLGASIATMVSFSVVWGIRMANTYKLIRWNIPIIKQIVGYFLLVIQVLLCAQESHDYGWQFLVILLLLLLNKDSIKGFIYILVNRIGGMHGARDI